MQLNVFLATYKSGNASNPKIVVLDAMREIELYSGTYHTLAVNLSSYVWVTNEIASWNFEDNTFTIEIYV